MRKFNVKTTKGVWVDFPDDEEVKLLIKPVSLLALTKMPSDDKIAPTDVWSMFDNMVLDWKGIQDEDGQNIKCDKENKQMVYEFDQDLVAFVVEKSSELRDQITGSEKALKNLKTSPSGEVTKQEK